MLIHLITGGVLSLTVSFSVPIKPQREAKRIQTSERRVKLKCVSKNSAQSRGDVVRRRVDHSGN